jgi:GNAT superfamily N-acetyltransferase
MIILSIQDKEEIPNLNTFDCGVAELNLYLVKYAKQNDKNGLGKTFVGVEKNKIVGFFTLATAQVSFETLPKDLAHNLPHYPIPAIRIARFGVDKHFQSKGFGAELLRLALGRILMVSLVTGVYLVLVDAKETAKGFYEHFGFMPLQLEPSTYFIAVETLRKAINQ